jgi:uncharacterized protein YajQ (UPF0234 family)
MADQCSFDVTSNVDLQEVDNALNQARKEVAQRYDFKGAKASIEFDTKEMKLVSSPTTTSSSMRSGKSCRRGSCGATCRSRT